MRGWAFLCVCCAICSSATADSIVTVRHSASFTISESNEMWGRWNPDPNDPGVTLVSLPYFDDLGGQRPIVSAQVVFENVTESWTGYATAGHTPGQIGLDGFGYTASFVDHHLAWGPRFGPMIDEPEGTFVQFEVSRVLDVAGMENPNPQTGSRAQRYVGTGTAVVPVYFSHLEFDSTSQYHAWGIRGGFTSASVTGEVAVYYAYVVPLPASVWGGVTLLGALGMVKWWAWRRRSAGPSVA
jgi:hypothetical protein